MLEHDLAAPVSRAGQPTDALPGSEEKIQVLTERAERHEPLFHPQDRIGKKVPTRSPKLAPGDWRQPESA